MAKLDPSKSSKPASKAATASPAPAAAQAAAPAVTPVAHDATFSGVLVGPLQLRVLHVLWSMPERQGNVATVHTALNSQSHPILAYTTVLTVLRNLARRRIVAQIPGARQHIFRVYDEQPAYERKLAQAILADIFGGDLKRFLAAVKA